MKKIYLVLDHFPDDKIIVSSDEIYPIVKTFTELDRNIWMKDEIPIFSYCLCGLAYNDSMLGNIEFYALYCDGTFSSKLESGFVSNTLKKILKKNEDKRKEVLSTRDTSTNDHTLTYACKLNTFLQSCYEIADRIKQNFPDIRPENEYELLKLVLSKDPIIGPIYMIEDLENGNLIRKRDDLETIRMELMNTPISKEKGKYLFYTTNGYTIQKTETTYDIQRVDHIINTDYQF